MSEEDCHAISVGAPELLEQILLKIPEMLPDGILVVSDNGQIVFFNAQAELLFGYGRQEVLGHTVEMLIPAALREQHVKHRLAYAEEPRLREMGRGLELMALHKKGYSFPVQIMLSPIVISPAGVYVIAVVRRVYGK